MVRTVNSSIQMNCLPARRHRGSWNALSSVSPGFLPIHVLAGVGPWAVERKLDDQPDGLDHSTHSSNSLDRPNLAPDGGGDKCGKY